MMHKWNRIDKFIFNIESFFNKKQISDEGITGLYDSEPDEDDFKKAQYEFDQSEFAKIKGYRTPRPLRASSDGFSCSRCGRILMQDIDLNADNGNYCQFCGQMYVISVPSKAAIEYMANHSGDKDR